ncbi:HdeA family protein [Laribacter hongkongensis]|jgi:acid stress chaperone HdeA|uniref:Probable acid stress chaperone HdeA n=2 Tax=Laribacter hongkongensis TaxID=168471 RepID=C1D4E4_LARHH|nr:acid-activated periplasmic chaperone HdeA [Laribacter hongkongensis]ACO73738.1 HdeA [Laribacter hongkongensis HLHK9]ASJ23569.1 putative acid stress chaperone HdeA [Laribacter hongkongensis]MBE5530082.1 hypothetical protein [Laribacter hongkongensis]MCG8992022.1 HdeA family protein [Laribacter hongkongensis]MCG8995440.1 HdeA family protein [Laribacter hongkongensis]
MKTRSATVLAALALALGAGMAHAADAAGKTASPKGYYKWTCQDFLDLDESFKPKVVYWAEGFNNKGKPDAAMVDVQGVEKIIPVVVDQCKLKPTEKLMKIMKSAKMTAGH